MTTREIGSLVAVGWVRSPWSEPGDVPMQGGPAIIEIDPAYDRALDHIERSSHIVVLAFLHKADRTVQMASPRKLAPDAPPWGVFATRSPARPNPIALSTTALLRRDGLLLHVDPLDLVDGTPVVDIKSYSPGWDNVFSATSTRRLPLHLLPDEMVTGFLQRDLRNHLGSAWQTFSAQRALEAVRTAIRYFELDPRDGALSVEVGVCDATIDAIMAMTGASFANGRLRVAGATDEQVIRFRAGARELLAPMR